MTKNFAANMKIGAVMGSSVGRVFGGLKSKIKDQENTLKSLRAAYKDASKGVGEYAGKLDDLKDKTAAAERELKRLRAASKISIGDAMGKVGSTFAGDAKRLAVGAGIVGGIGVGIVSDMLRTTATFEKALTILETIEGNGDKAKAAFSWVQGFAAKTPYELQNVLDAFVKLKAYGIDPVANDTLRVLGDTASAMGKDLEQAVEAMADAVTGENERLKEFGIKASKENGKIMYRFTDRAGKEQTKLVDANNRKLIQSTLLSIFNSKYQGAMQKQSQTWDGMLSNLKDSWAQFSFQVMQSGPFNQLKEQLGGFLKRLEVWSKDGTLKRWAEQTGAKLTEFGTKLGQVIQGIYKGLDAAQSFLGGWDKLGYALIALNFAPTIAAIGSMAVSLWTMTGATWAAVGPWLALAAAIGSVIYIFNNLDTVGEKVNAFYDAIFGEGFTLMMGDFFNELANLPSTIEHYTDLAFKVFQDWAEKTARVIREAFTAVFNWLAEQFNMISNKITAMWDKAKALGESVKSFFGFGSAASPTSAPVTPSESMPDRSTSMNQSNNFNINVNAPGADGRRIADQLRNEFNRKPLFDSDGALAPG